jgi:hypothetical protein
MVSREEKIFETKEFFRMRLPGLYGMAAAGKKGA